MRNFLGKLKEVKWGICGWYVLMALFAVVVVLPLASFLGVLAGTLLGIVIMGTIG